MAARKCKLKLGHGSLGGDPKQTQDECLHGSALHSDAETKLRGRRSDCPHTRWGPNISVTWGAVPGEMKYVPLFLQGGATVCVFLEKETKC